MKPVVTAIRAYGKHSFLLVFAAERCRSLFSTDRIRTSATWVFVLLNSVVVV